MVQYRPDMKDQLKTYLLSAITRALAPLVKVLIKAGVSHKEFSEVSKSVYVRVARDDYGVQGRKTNMSRVAILTGLSRKECLRVRRLIEDKDEVEFLPNPAARVVTAWASEREFLDANGEPLVLAKTGPHPSVESLFQRFAGDIPTGALIKELERVGAIADSGECWTLKKRTFIPRGFDRDRIRILATQLSDLGNTIYYNLVQEGAPRMQRYVVNDGALSPYSIVKFQQVATEKGQQLLEELERELNFTYRERGNPCNHQSGSGCLLL